MDIKNYRDEIDAIDDKIVELFVKRMDVAEKIASIKKLNGKLVTDGKREEEILSRVCSNVKDEYKNYCRQLFLTLLYVSKDYQKNVLEEK